MTTTPNDGGPAWVLAVMDDHAQLAATPAMRREMREALAAIAELIEAARNIRYLGPESDVAALRAAISRATGDTK